MSDRARPPPPMRYFESLADQQIREAQQRGELDNLPGAGKPIEGLDQPYDEAWWIKDKLRRERLEVVPPALAIRKEIDVFVEGIARLSSEAEVRERAAELND